HAQPVKGGLEKFKILYEPFARMGPGICFCSINAQVRVTETALNPEGEPPSLDLNFVTGIVVANDSVSVLQHLALQLEGDFLFRPEGHALHVVADA
ncbi:hypothetical protein, partial [Pseudomonas aeruginosa]